MSWETENKHQSVETSCLRVWESWFRESRKSRDLRDQVFERYFSNAFRTQEMPNITGGLTLTFGCTMKSDCVVEKEDDHHLLDSCHHHSTLIGKEDEGGHMKKPHCIHSPRVVCLLKTVKTLINGDHIAHSFFSWIIIYIFL